MDIKLSLPSGYHELRDADLRIIYQQIAENVLFLEDIRTLFLMRRLSAVAVKAADGTTSAIFRHVDATIEITAAEMAVWITQHLQWIGEIPAFPCRLRYIKPSIFSSKISAVDARLQDISFEKFITLDNYYQGFLHTSRLQMLCEMEKIMYPGISHQTSDQMSYRHINIFYWFAAFKNWAAAKWDCFLRPIAPDDALPARNLPSAKLMHRAIDTQIRALTKGDVTKEKEVLAMSCHRALTELDFLAKEAEEIKSKMKQQ